ncbi:hypothetical protein ACQX0N_14210, partial [Clostridium tepidum]
DVLLNKLEKVHDKSLNNFVNKVAHSLMIVIHCVLWCNDKQFDGIVQHLKNQNPYAPPRVQQLLHGLLFA